jgi:hypothetical protein
MGNPHYDHYCPQYDFIFDSAPFHSAPFHSAPLHSAPGVVSTGKQLVKHIIRFENLDYEFNSLMKTYNLPVALITKSLVSVKSGLTVDDFYPQTIDRINKFYHNDFVHFGYSKRNTH